MYSSLVRAGTDGGVDPPRYDDPINSSPIASEVRAACTVGRRDTFTAHSDNHQHDTTYITILFNSALTVNHTDTFYRLATYTMSRHKIVKNLDLDDELDDYDGGDDYAEDGTEGMEEL